MLDALVEIGCAIERYLRAQSTTLAGLDSVSVQIVAYYSVEILRSEGSTARASRQYLCLYYCL